MFWASPSALDDSLIVTVGDDYTRKWDSASGEEIGEYPGDEPATTFISHDCSKLITKLSREADVRVHSFGACGNNEQLMATANERAKLVTEAPRRK